MKRLFYGFLISLFLISQSWATDGWQKSEPAGTQSASDIDSYVIQNNAALDLGLSNLRQGCVLTYSSASVLSVGAGSLVVSNSAGTIRLMLAKTSAISTVWTVGDNGLDTGSEAASTTYYVYAIASAVTDTAYTVKISTNSSVPSGVTYYKRLGSFYNDSSSNITYSDIVNDDNYYGKKLGSWVTKSVDTAYQATTDGFVVVISVSNTVIYGYTDSSNPPTTLRAKNLAVGDTCSFTMVVKRNDYWKTTASAGSPTVYWIPQE